MRNPVAHVTDVELLEQWLADVTEEIMTGKTAASFGAGESSGSDFIWKNITPQQRQAFLLDRLNELEPEKYPTDASSHIITRTTRRFNDLQ
jgi:hypothetical protein